ncbi:MAG: efflux RND transporter periplasmic adaptor subunit [Bryobacteraceae bacterium]
MRLLWKALPLACALLVLGALGFVAPRFYKLLSPTSASVTPTTRVRRGDVVLSVYANGTLQGGNSKMVVAPMVGSNSLTITELGKSGELVHEGDVVARFDTTEETYKLREAQADMEEAEQQVIQAEAEAAAKEEELNNELITARGDLRDAELEARRNPLLAAIAARQNELAVEGARERLAKLEHDYPERKAAAKASINIQQAAREKAKIQVEMAQRNIDMMSVKATASGYINVERNMNQNMWYSGMTLPLYQVGDQTRAGMAVAQIPDMSHWEVAAEVAETDRGHLSIGQPAEVQVIALPNRTFQAHVKDMGGTAGNYWERHFECRLAMANPVPELRPGMSVRILITTETLRDALWLPAQALFESDGRTYVYLHSGQGFSRKDVQLVRRSESKVVVTGLKEGDEVSLASPDQQESGSKKGGAGNAAKAVAK